MAAAAAAVVVVVVIGYEARWRGKRYWIVGGRGKTRGEAVIGRKAKWYIGGESASARL
ncbi:uncharacterized protein H6S33_004103 [Morchella sextelata]|uniref:uncharacterized protein n=1 Tax=Morchella sextelata TaxID=1174677 RepID=UPI001D03B8F7|nr:uncharacterized protein H6S33_004103 [Morchella sextelata]KAH0606442.1 hypothetical protein H6S33_004103 [Morchella sextelata]